MLVALDVTSLIGVRTGVGHAVAGTLAALEARPGGPDVIPYALSLRARSHRGELPPGTVFPPYPARFLLSSWRHFDAPRLGRRLRRADVVHAINYLAPPSAAAVVVTIHDTFLLREPASCAPAQRSLAPIIRRAVARGAWVHTPSVAVAEEVVEELRVPADRVVAVPWGIPPLLAPDHAAPPFHAPYILALGALEPRKNLPRLVSAFGEIARRDADVLLVLAGPDGGASADVAHAIDSLGPPSGRVIRVGEVDDGLRSALLKGARVLAYPSLTEGFGFPLLEAMSLGTVVVASDTGAIPEVAGDGALLIDPGDVDSITEALWCGLTDETVRRDLVAAGTLRAAHFTWEATADGLATLYRRAASSTASS